ncbi:hypothetical protein [Nakamurella aerolata]|uniref:Uncharacterized protein n=1 Tax=Nakamurella aerolata TaxID=1656892 RepID=A0A849AJE4_9ACTN|nr:hypothetical protein [Nakamurella aerolata]NNG36932.1 hypothetical protein [Nakamurella aerolata]
MEIDMDNATCSVTNCDLPTRKAGMCVSHYMKQWRYGTPTPTFEPRALRDVVGRRFGALMVTGERIGRTWVCLCDCGNTTRATRDGLLNGMRIACGDKAAHYRREDAGYYAAHDRVKRDRGRAAEHLCVDCSQPAQEWSYNHDDPDERISVASSSAGAPYSLSPAHYSPRCIACHRRFDGNPVATRRPA